MATVIFNNVVHRCVVFNDILDEEGQDIQANQFLIIHNDEGLLFDPGGIKVFDPLLKSISNHINPYNIKTIVLSHQNPDAGAAISSWTAVSSGKIMKPSLWLRFIPHFVRTKALYDYFVPS